MPLFGFSIGPKAADFLDAMPAGKLRAQVAKRVWALMDDPRPSGCKKLTGVTHGTDPVWRVRSGDYRILYVCRPNEIVVIDIDHRKDVYR